MATVEEVEKYITDYISGKYEDDNKISEYYVKEIIDKAKEVYGKEEASKKVYYAISSRLNKRLSSNSFGTENLKYVYGDILLVDQAIKGGLNIYVENNLESMLSKYYKNLIEMANKIEEENALIDNRSRIKGSEEINTYSRDKARKDRETLYKLAETGVINYEYQKELFESIAAAKSRQKEDEKREKEKQNTDSETYNQERYKVDPKKLETYLNYYNTGAYDDAGKINKKFVDDLMKMVDSTYGKEEGAKKVFNIICNRLGKRINSLSYGSEVLKYAPGDILLVEYAIKNGFKLNQPVNIPGLGFISDISKLVSEYYKNIIEIAKTVSKDKMFSDAANRIEGIDNSKNKFANDKTKQDVIYLSKVDQTGILDYEYQEKLFEGLNKQSISQEELDRLRTEMNNNSSLLKAVENSYNNTISKGNTR